MENHIALTSKRTYTLAEMIAQCDRSAPPPADMADWDQMKSVGGEVWWGRISRNDEGPEGPSIEVIAKQ